MNIVKIIYEDESYDSGSASNDKMAILGELLATDLYCCQRTSLREWALADKEDPNSKFGYISRGDATAVKKGEDGFIYISYEWIRFDEISESNSAKMSRQQFVQLLDDWHEKVCKPKAKEVIIKDENGQFVIEAKD